MAILACGVNHNTAPLAVRERMSISDHSHDKWLTQLMKQSAINEAAILSTCNRTELYCETPSPAQIVDWLSDRYRLTTGDVKNHLYVYRENDAVRHMMRVACGLDSMVLGESQILGQIKQTYQRAVNLGTVGPHLSSLFRHVFSVSKRVRTETAIGEFPVSVAYASTILAKKIFTDFTPLKMLVIGAGKTSVLAARHFQQQGVEQFIIANRSLQNAELFSEEFNAEAILLSDIPKRLHEVDIVVSATASPLPLLTQSMVSEALKARRYRLMLMVDLGVPRDIEGSVSELEDVFLYNVDDMQGIVEDGLSERQDAAHKAENIIELELDNFIRWRRSLGSVSVIREYRDKMQTLADDELERALRLIESGKSPEDVLREYSRRLLNKVTHQPSIRLRRAGFDGRDDLLNLAQYLFSDNS